MITQEKFYKIVYSYHFYFNLKKKDIAKMDFRQVMSILHIMSILCVYYIDISNISKF